MKSFFSSLTTTRGSRPNFDANAPEEAQSAATPGGETAQRTRTPGIPARLAKALRLPAQTNDPTRTLTSAQIVEQELNAWVQAAPVKGVIARTKLSEKIQDAYQSRSTTLRLGSWGVTSLPNCMGELRALTVLHVSYNKLTRLPALPEGLTELHARTNRLTALPDSLPAGLTTLEVWENKLTRLPALPEGLTKLDASRNRLTALPDSLPVGLTRLEVGENKLTRLPALPEGLTKLGAGKNGLTALPDSLPAGLKELSVGENKLTRLPALPEELTGLYVSNNYLTALPDLLPAGLLRLKVCKNKLARLPALPEGLTALHISKNTMFALPDSLPAGLTIVDECGNFLRRRPARRPVQLQTQVADAAPAIDVAPLVPDESIAVGVPCNQPYPLPGSLRLGVPCNQPYSLPGSQRTGQTPTQDAVPDSTNTASSTTQNSSDLQQQLILLDENERAIFMAFQQPQELLDLVKTHSKFPDFKTLAEHSSRLSAVAKSDAIAAQLVNFTARDKNEKTYYQAFFHSMESAYDTASILAQDVLSLQKSGITEAMRAAGSFDVLLATCKTVMDTVAPIASCLPGVSAGINVVAAGMQTRANKKLHEEFGNFRTRFKNRQEFGAVIHNVACEVCKESGNAIQKFEETNEDKDSRHRLGMRSASAPSTKIIIRVWEKLMQATGAKIPNLSLNSELGRKAMRDAGALVDALVEMDPLEEEIFENDKTRWLASKLVFIPEKRTEPADEAVYQAQRQSANSAASSSRPSSQTSAEPDNQTLLAKQEATEAILHSMKRELVEANREIAALKRINAENHPESGGVGNGGQMQVQAIRSMGHRAGSTSLADVSRRLARLETDVPVGFAATSEALAGKADRPLSPDAPPPESAKNFFGRLR